MHWALESSGSTLGHPDPWIICLSSVTKCSTEAYSGLIFNNIQHHILSVSHIFVKNCIRFRVLLYLPTCNCFMMITKGPVWIRDRRQFIILAKAVARMSACHVWVHCYLKPHGMDQDDAHLMSCITEEEHWVWRICHFYSEKKPVCFFVWDGEILPHSKVHAANKALGNGLGKMLSASFSLHLASENTQGCLGIQGGLPPPSILTHFILIAIIFFRWGKRLRADK